MSACWSRRQFIGHSATALAASSRAWAGQGTAATPRFEICAFVKFLQSLSYQKLADTIKQLGFAGIEATVREGGQVLPKRVEEDLPRLVEALKQRGLAVTVMASSVNSVDQPLTEKVLRTAARLGIKRYRMAYFRYQAGKSVVQQLRELKPVIRDLVALNRELGLTAVYQNHAGARFVGAPLWDLYELIKDHSPKQIAAAFDIRHATVEGGLAWPLHFDLLLPHLGAIYVKDFRWLEGQSAPVNVPLGQGRVDPRFFQVLKGSPFRGPISLHVEYLPKAGIPENITALRRDLATLRQKLGER